ncbi:hypothetical protein CF131_09140 [Aeromonas dhakensis]|nr:hypothetical protein CF131_09140 [Aeromonas dhakensis]TNI41472.1 hypothetical protein CF130_18400 [Aeromonas dhakensis]
MISIIPAQELFIESSGIDIHYSTSHFVNRDIFLAIIVRTRQDISILMQISYQSREKIPIFSFIEILIYTFQTR